MNGLPFTEASNLAINQRFVGQTIGLYFSKIKST
jgi:hypothetical protein